MLGWPCLACWKMQKKMEHVPGWQQKINMLFLPLRFCAHWCTAEIKGRLQHWCPGKWDASSKGLRALDENELVSLCAVCRVVPLQALRAFDVSGMLHLTKPLMASTYTSLWVSNVFWAVKAFLLQACKAVLLQAFKAFLLQAFKAFLLQAFKAFLLQAFKAFWLQAFNGFKHVHII